MLENYIQRKYWHVRWQTCRCRREKFRFLPKNLFFRKKNGIIFISTNHSSLRIMSFRKALSKLLDGNRDCLGHGSGPQHKGLGWGSLTRFFFTIEKYSNNWDLKFSKMVNFENFLPVARIGLSYHAYRHRKHHSFLLRNVKLFYFSIYVV